MSRHHGGGERKGGITCFSCGAPGHHIRDCPKRPAGGGGGQRRESGGYQPHHAAGGPRPLASDMPLNLGATSLDAQKRIKQLLIMMTPDEQSLTRMSLSLLEDIRAHNLSDFVIATLVHCIKCLPHKSMPFVGLLASLRIQQTRVNADEADKFMHSFLEHLTNEFIVVQKQAQWNELRLLLRFTCGLGCAGLVPQAIMWNVLNRILSWLEQEQQGQQEMVESKRNYLLYTLLSALPFLSDLYETEEYTKFRGALMNQVGKRKRTQLLSLVKPLSAAASTAAASSSTAATAAAAASSSSSSSSATPTPYFTAPFTFDLIDSWLLSLSTLTSRLAYLDDASEVSIQRGSYSGFKKELEKCKAVDWTIMDSIHVGAPNVATSPAPHLRSILRLFTRSYTGFPLNDLLVGDYISDLLICFESLHKEGTKQLLSLPLPFEDEARTVGQYLLVETLFENLLTVPKAPIKEVYYGTIFIDLFKAQPNLLPPLVGHAVNFFFHRLDRLELDTIERLLNWFTFHLSNFGYAWPWIAWNYVLQQPESNRQRRFVQQALALCVRLSYWERIQHIIPEDFIPLMPHQPTPAFRFSTKNIEKSNGDLSVQQYHQYSLELMSIIQGKSTPNALVQWLDQTVTPTLGSEARVRLFTPCILECGNKSYSHLIALLERYKSVFEKLCNTTTKKKIDESSSSSSSAGAMDTSSSSESAAPVAVIDTLQPTFDIQRLILNSLSEYWQHSIQHIIVLLDQFYSFGILSIQAVIGSTFFASRHPTSQPHLWQATFFSILQKSLVKLQNEIDTIKEKPKSMSLTQEKRQADESSILGIQLERRDLLVMCVKNFLKLSSEALHQAKRAATSAKEREKERYELEAEEVKDRFKQFVRVFYADLAPHLAQIQEVVPKTSPLAEVVADIPLLL